MAATGVPESLPQRIAAIREQLARLRESVDPDALRARVAELEREVADLRAGHTVQVTDDDLRLLTLDGQLADSEPAFS